MTNKITFYLFLFLTIGFYSCSSDEMYESLEQPASEAKSQIVSFDLKEFSSQLSPLSTRSTSDISNYTIYYFVHKDVPLVPPSQEFPVGGNNIVKSKKYAKGEITSIKDTLLQGDYIVNVFATTAEITSNDIEFVGTHDLYQAAIAMNKFSNDIFHQSFKLKVGQENINQVVNLNRIVGKVEIVLQDAVNMPEEFVSLSIGGQLLSTEITNTITQYYDVGPKYFNFDGTTQMSGYYDTFSYMYSDERSKVILNNDKNPFSFYMFSTTTLRFPGKFDVRVQLNKKDGKDPIDKIIKKEIQIIPNQVLRLTGKLFDNKVENNISIDSEWGISTEEGFDK